MLNNKIHTDLEIDFGEQASKNSIAKTQDKTSLKCIPPSSNPPANISWLFNGKPLEYRIGIYRLYFDFSTSSLEFLRVSYSDSGLYVCQASNQFAPVTIRTGRTIEMVVEGTRRN